MKTPTQTTQNLTILHDSKEWSTNLDGEICEIRVDGRKLNDIHDLACKIDKMTTVTKALAFVATFLAVVSVAIVGGIGSWLADNKDKISSNIKLTDERFSKRINQLHSSNVLRGTKLKSLGWAWEDGQWQQIGNTSPSPSK